MMKLPRAFQLSIWFCLVAAIFPRDATRTKNFPLQMAQEREIMTRKELDEYLASKEDNTGPLLELAKSTFGGIITLSKIDYSQSGGQIAWEVTEAVVPIIGAALAFIPGVGPLVSGVFLGLWGLLSPMFAPKTENPMEKIIKELAQNMERKIDEKLSNVINLGIYGEIVRNNYICSKYTFISQEYSEEFKSNTSLQENDALKLMIYLNDCDNFLKDTAEAFVYDDYADVLWVPAAIVTSTRLGFLAELIKSGHLIGLTPKVTGIYLQELKKDINRQFKYYSKGLDKAHQHMKERFNRDKKYLKDVTPAVKAACKLQSQFLYFDAQSYPHGMPKVLNNTDMFATVKMDDHYNHGKDKSVKHLQVFFNVTKSKYPSILPKRKDPYFTIEIMNCFVGPLFLSIPSTYWFNFYTVHGKKFSYEFRVMFLEIVHYSGNEYSVPVLTEFNKASDKFQKYLAVHKKLHDNEDAKSRTCLNIEFVFPRDKKVNESKRIVEVPGSTLWNECPYGEDDISTCNTFKKTWKGKYMMYSAGSFNHKNEDVNPLIAIDDPSLQAINYQHREPAGYLLGVEIILRPQKI